MIDDPLDIFGITAEQLVDQYPSQNRGLLGSTGDGVTKPRLMEYAEDASGRVMDAMLQRGFDPQAIEQERPSMWRMGRRAIIMAAVSDALATSQRLDEAEFWRRKSERAIKQIMTHETDIAVDLPTFVR